MKNLYLFRNILFLLLLFNFTLIGSVKAQSVIVDQPLFFGTFVIVDFGVVAEISIANNGNFSNNANTYIIDNPTRGEYTLTGAPTDALYTITVPATVNVSGPGGNFVLDNIVARPVILRTDAFGEDQFRLVGRLRSAGGGTFYGDGTYSDTFTIIFNF